MHWRHLQHAASKLLFWADGAHRERRARHLCQRAVQLRQTHGLLLLRLRERRLRRRSLRRRDLFYPTRSVLQRAEHLEVSRRDGHMPDRHLLLCHHGRQLPVRLPERRLQRLHNQPRLQRRQVVRRRHLQELQRRRALRRQLHELHVLESGLQHGGHGLRGVHRGWALRFGKILQRQCVPELRHKPEVRCDLRGLRHESAVYGWILSSVQNERRVWRCVCRLWGRHAAVPRSGHNV